MGSWILFVLGGIAVGIVVYNRIVVLFRHRRNAFADMDVHLDHRYNAIPAVVEIVEKYAGHGHSVFKKVTDARVAAKDVYGVGKNRFKAENKLGKALLDLFTFAENYPELKANESFMALKQELSDLENKISDSRKIFNSITAEYNAAIKQFPGNIMAKFFGYLEEPCFKTDGDKEEAATAKSPAKVKKTIAQ